MAEIPPGSRACKWCRTVFAPTRRDQKWCKARCRKDAGRYRKRHGQGDLTGSDDPILSSESIRDELQEHCELTARVMPEDEAFLMAFARTKEAEEQVKRWANALKVRRDQLQKLQRPSMSARVLRLTTDAPIEFPQSDERFMGLACSSPQLAILVYGRKTESAGD